MERRRRRVDEIAQALRTGRHVGHHCRTPRECARVGRCPTVQPQPILAPLTPRPFSWSRPSTRAARQTVHDALPDISGLVRAIGFRDPDQAAVGGHLDRLRCVGPAVLRSAAGRAAPVHRARRPTPPRSGHPGRPVVPHPGRVDGRLLRVGRQARQGDGGRDHRRRRGARLPVLRQPRSARLRRRHREPRRAACGQRHRDRRRGSRFRRRPAMSTCRSTCTTWRPGIRCR